MLRAIVCAALVISAVALREQPRPSGTELEEKKKQDAEVAKKFDELGKATRNVTYRWQHPYRVHNSTNNGTDKVPKHKGPFKNVSFCGQKKKIPMKFRNLWNPAPAKPILGRPAERAQQNFQMTRTRSFLQTGHPGEDSYATPGAGGTQKLAEGGAAGQVDGKEPFATVLKDGFWEVGCFADSMLTSADKFGNEKDKYKDQADVSIALYDELLDDADKKDMTPTVCFEFCSTLPRMVYFGITEGRKCYCTPYYKPGAGASGNCDAVCVGDQTQRCGSTAGKSSVFQMHLCNDA